MKNKDMKKTYILPSVDVYEMQLANVIAASVNSLTNEEVDSGTEDNPINFGREGNFFDDED